MDFQSRYKALNQEQKQAVDTTEGPVMVIAGPGSGKTELLGVRTGKILQETDTDPSSILCLTFTDAASVNLRRRLFSLIGDAAYRVGVYTFHSFCADLMGRYSSYYPGFGALEPADALTQYQVLNELFEAMAYDNPLRSVHPEKGFIYLKSARSRIDELKRAGLTAEVFSQVVVDFKKELETVSAYVEPVFAERISKKSIDRYKQLLTDLELLKSTRTVSWLPTAREHLAQSLRDIFNADEVSTTALSEWKRTYSEAGKFKWQSRIGKYEALSALYGEYQQKMYDRGLADYSDLILNTIEMLTREPGVLADVQEQYQYIMVDEFQDTNGAQLSILELLTNNEIYEGRPNVLVVGDDDQAIFKFQGAEHTNLSRFLSSYRQPEVITLKTNYRSTETIIQQAEVMRGYIEFGIESLLPDIKKEFNAGRASAGTQVRHIVMPHQASELSFIADNIAQRISAGTAPEGIAVIARSHRSLANLATVLSSKKVPIKIDAAFNILERSATGVLLSWLKLLDAISRRDKSNTLFFLSEVLGHPMFGIKRVALWQVFKVARMDIGKALADVGLEDFWQVCAELGGRVPFEPVEDIADYLTGTREFTSEAVVFQSPYKNYFWSEDNAERLINIASVRALLTQFREYRHGGPGKVKDLLLFIALHESAGEALVDTLSRAGNSNAVELITAHASKGREFDIVYILSGTQKEWAGRGHIDTLPFPVCWPLSPAGDGADDQARLFYVAATRARDELIVASHLVTEDGKEALPAPFIAHLDSERENVSEVTNTSFSIDLALSPSEYEYIARLLEDYSLSATHFNNFFDVEKGGPQYYVDRNLLMLPEARNASSEFGVAVHASLEWVYRVIEKEHRTPSVEEASEHFQETIDRAPLKDNDRKFFADKGIVALRAYLTTYADELRSGYFVEVDFKDEGVVCNGVSLNGKIDRLLIEDEQTTVIDYKTGKALSDWDTGEAHLKKKSYQYHQQLVFYRLLIEGSRRFSNTHFKEGILDFVEPLDGAIIRLRTEITDEDVARMKVLISAMMTLVNAQDFISTDGFARNVDGIREFEEHVIKYARAIKK